MKSLYQLEKNRTSAQTRYYKKQDELQKQIAKLEAEKDALKYPHLLDYMKQLGKACLPKIKGAVNFELYGPFGLSNECSIYFHAKQKPGEKEGKTLAGATFTSCGSGGYGLKGSKDTGRFAAGTIGELNGGNYETIKITEKMTIDWFIKFAKKGFNKK